MPYTHSFFEYRRDGVASREHGTGGTPAGTDPGSIGWARPAGSVIVCDDTNNMYQFDGTTWDQKLDADSTFSDAADLHDMTTAIVENALADSANAVHAAYATGVNVNFPGPFTNPDVPRNARLDFSALYDGGDITVTGTDINDAALVEVVADVPGGSAYSVGCFKTITAAVQQALGAGGVTCSIGYGHKFGLAVTPAKPTGVLDVAGVTEAVTIDSAATTQGFTPTSLPNGALDFRLEYPRAGAATTVTATP